MALVLSKPARSARTALSNLPIIGQVTDAIIRAATKKTRQVTRRAGPNRRSPAITVVSRRPRRGLRRPAHARKSGETMLTTQPKYSPIPVQLNVGIGNSLGWIVAGSADKQADFSANRSMKIRGTALMPAANVIAIGSGSSYYCFTDNGTITGAPQSYVPLIPKNIDPRVDQIAQVFQWYAFRNLRFRYINFWSGGNVPAASDYTMTNNGLVFAVADDPDRFPSAFLGASGAAALLEYETAMLTSSTGPCEMKYSHKGGSRLWSMKSAEADAELDVQANLLGQFVMATNVAQKEQLGIMAVDYELDLYDPAPVAAALERPALRIAIDSKRAESTANVVELSDVKDEKLAHPALTKLALVRDEKSIPSAQAKAAVSAPVSPTASQLAKTLPADALREARATWFAKIGLDKANPQPK